MRCGDEGELLLPVLLLSENVLLLSDDMELSSKDDV
jgi:hypothetical protein